MHRIKVLWLSTPLIPRYGVAGTMQDWASGFDFDRFDVTFAFGSPQPDELRVRFARFPRLKLVHLPELASLRQMYVPGICALVKLMRKERFDVVHTVFIQADILGTLAARMTGVPVVVSSAMGHLIGSMQGPPFVRFMKRAIYRTAFRMIRGRIARHFPITRSTGEHLQKDFGVAGGNIQVVYCGVEVVQRERPPRSPDSLLIGSAGQLIRPKGVHTLVEALPHIIARVPQTRVVIAGEGPEQSRLAQLAAELGVTDRIEFIGFCEDMPTLMAKLDVFVFPSFPSYDGLPRVILEAMVQRTPVAAARTAPIQEVVREADTGWLFEPGDAAGLATAVLSIHSDSRRANELVERAHRLVREISIENEVAQMQQAYCALLEQARCL